MQLLVSVASAIEAAAAAAGGADIIDAKDPSRGALAPVSPPVFAAIVARAAGRPVSAALGDAADVDSDDRAAAFARAGAAFVKIGFAGTPDTARMTAVLQETRRAAGGCGVVAVAYADWVRVGAPALSAVLEAAAGARASGVLLDTGDKQGPGLRALMTTDEVRSWVRRASALGLRAAIAGRLLAADVEWARRSGAAILGVRTAACVGGRAGRVSSARVRALVESIGGHHVDLDPRRQRRREARIQQVP